jgi:hypothetical protein
VQGSEFEEAEFFRKVAAREARVRALSERQLSPEEIRAALAQPLDEAAEEESRALIRWFRRRYPTPAERLAYVRRAYRRWRDAAPRGACR